MNKKPAGLLLFSGLFFFHCVSDGDAVKSVRFCPIQKAWAGNSVNAVIFRRNSVVTHDSIQYTAFYDDKGNVILAKRILPAGQWKIRRTRYHGNIRDAHNSISIMTDGAGYLHMAWNHHNSPLQYCRSLSPGSLNLSDPLAMTGELEDKVTYPEFYRLPDGNLVFLYRDGASGRGNLVLNYYDRFSRTWCQRQKNLISGEEERSAYWQAAVDVRGHIHLSWVWRETWDVASNHDLCYARSSDGGITWNKSTGESCSLPITVMSAEYAWRIPQNHELINQTSMCTDRDGHPVIATYWREGDSEVPQYHIVFHDGRTWRMSEVSHRKTPFSLSGGGTKRIPMSRPQVVATDPGACLIFRDAERNNRISAAVCGDLGNPEWHIHDLTDTSVGQWEPTYDTVLWDREQVLHLFVQCVSQQDAEGVDARRPEMAGILECGGEGRGRRDKR
ncbi:BNR repeat-containing protein [bacterium]|nr:BNR repeat-containing protein [bacterium]